ncbi:MAG: hypothetical protein DMD81_07795 [Candidatus Rokuibacteriota bacterium]|nr:MAG: hypothetical protein DMD81_07795 [Candidatus Rokubacteria bacterium]
MRTPEEIAMSRMLAVGAIAVLVTVLGVVPDAPAQTKDDTVVYAIQSDMQNWDPPNSVLRESIIMGYNVFDHLAARDLKTGKVGPSLATSWRNLDDTTWEVKLRPNVKFHDGTKFTARDVKATFDRVLNPENKITARGNHAKIKSVEVVDEGTVRFKTDGPYPLFVERMTALVMQSEKVIKEKGHEWMQENPVGTGPYKLVKWTRKQEHLLVRNDDYWGPKPAFKYVRVRIIPEQATQIAELMAGGVDIDGIIKHVLNGLGDRTATTVNPMAFGFDANLKPYKQDAAAAKKLLADAGYPNGFEVGFLTTAPTVEPALPQTSEAISADLAKVGIRTKQRYVGEVGPFTNLVRDNKADPIFTWSWGYYSIFDADAIHCNPALDDLIAQGRSTLDQKKRLEVYAKAQKLIHDDAAYLFKWGLRGVWGISNRVEYEAPRDEVDRMFVVMPRKK